jgi:hypothetical protein
MNRTDRRSSGQYVRMPSELPPNLPAVVSALKSRGVPSVTVIEWWPSSRKRPWHHRVAGRAWIVADMSTGSNGSESPGTALGSDGYLHGFLWRHELTRRPSRLTFWNRSPKRVRASRLFPTGAIQYVPVAKWERDGDLEEFCRSHGIDIADPGSQA